MSCSTRSCSASAERAKFLAALELVDKQTPVLAGRPSSEDFLRVMRARIPALASSTRSAAGSPTRSRR